MRLLSLKFYFLIFFTTLALKAFGQYQIPQKPQKLYPIYDEVGLLTSFEKEKLNQKLIAFSDSTSTEISVIIIPTTQGEDINFVATLFGERWGIGQKGIDNGVVFLIATKDRAMSIQQGRAIEQYLTASTSGQILDYLVSPRFKQGLWYQGIDAGTTAIMEAVEGKFKPLKKPHTEQPISISEYIIIFCIIVIIFLAISGGNPPNDDDIILSRRGRRRYTGGFFPTNFGSGRGGGFGGFGGGGSFGGGGASGGW